MGVYPRSEDHGPRVREGLGAKFRCFSRIFSTNKCCYEKNVKNDVIDVMV